MRYVRSLTVRRLMILTAALVGGGVASGLLTPASKASPSADAIVEAAGGHAIVTVSPVTGLVTFVSVEPGFEIQAAGDTAQLRAKAFLLAYPAAFGIASGSDLWVLSTQRDELGLDHVRLLQLRGGYLVDGAYITVHVRGTGVSSVAARTIGPTPNINLTAVMTDVQATQAVTSLMAKHYPAATVTLSAPYLEVFPFELAVGMRRPAQLAWFVEAKAQDIRQFIWIDAVNKVVLLDIAQLPDARQRNIFDADGGGAWPGALARSEGQEAVGLPDVDLAYGYSGDFYNQFRVALGRDGIDGLGGPLRLVVGYCPSGGPCPYANAFWNGSEAVFGEGMTAADDIVAHELAHGVVEKAAGLLYYGQAGAINESFADFFGEMVDLVNTRGNDTPGQRWRIGEDLAGVGPIRDMMNPGTFSQPSWTGDSAYHCGGDDNGGVHANGAVLSHAFALMTDGGTFRGQTIAGIGLGRVSRIAYRALTAYLPGYLRTSSDFLTADRALRQACADLVGTSSVSGADCAEVEQALDAVDLQGPVCSVATSSPMCGPNEGPVNSFLDNFENLSAALWTTSYTVGENAWTRGSGSGTPAIRFGENPYGGQYSLRARTFAIASDSYVAMSSETVVPPGGRLQLMHSFGFEPGHDGGVVEYSVDGGSWQDARPLYSTGADYAPEPLLSDNPLAGRRAFTGFSMGYVATQYDLASLAGHGVRFRFRVGSDSQVAYDGWFIDDVRLFGCDASGMVQMAVSAATVAEAAGSVVVNVTRTAGTAGGVEIAYQTNDLTGTATAGQDYVSTSGTLTFDAGVMAKSFSVPIVNDTLDDDGETFDVELALVPGGTSAALGVPSVTTVTITDDDSAGSAQFSAEAATVAESASSVSLTVSRVGGLASGVTIGYRTVRDTAQPGSDYTETSGTLTFGANQSTRSFTVPILPDCLVEGAETFRVILENPGGGVVLGAIPSAVVTITDDDVAGAIQLGASSWSVGEGAGAVSIPVIRTGGAACVSVDYTTLDGTALAGQDFTSTLGRLVFDAGQTSRTLTVPILQDAINEGPETFAFTLVGNPGGGAVLGSPTSGIVTIVDDEASFEFSASTYTVGEADGTTSVVTVVRGGTTTGTATIRYKVSDGSAIAGTDYNAPSPNPGTLTFGPGVLSQTISLTIRNDSIPQGDHTILLRLLNASSVGEGVRDTAALVITDDDVAGTIAFATGAYQFNEDVGIARIPAHRYDNASGRATVDYHTEDRYSKAGVDYVAAAGTLTFEDGATSASIPITVLPDNAPKGHKEVLIVLSNVQGAALGKARTRLVIWDKEKSIEFLTKSFFNYEGNNASIMVIRGGDLSSTVTVNYATSNGTAIAPADYWPASGTVTLDSGVTSTAFAVTLNSDNLAEGDETVNLKLSNPNGGGFVLGGMSEAQLAFGDMQIAGVVSLDASNYVVTEGGNAVVTVSRRYGIGDGVTVQYQIEDGTAQGGTDFTPVTGTLTLNEATPVQTFSIRAKTDGLVEGAETATIRLVNPSGGVVLDEPSSAGLHILDADGQSFQFTALAPQVGESTGPATITVSRSGSAAAAATVEYDAAAGTATAGSDFTADHGMLTFAAGQKTRTFQVSVAPDDVYEGPETVRLSLSNPSAGATLGYPASTDLTIVDDDPAVSVGFSAATFTRVESGGRATITVTRSDATSGSVTVQYATSAGTATAGGVDYTDTDGTLTFAPGVTSKTFTVAISPDTVVEPNESLQLTLSNPGGGATLGIAQATLWIVDDD
jgi:Zn-dependent metalloprotease